MFSKIDLNVRLICKDCKDPIPNIVENFSEGNLICGNCGLVLLDRIIDTRSEWRTFSNSDEGNSDPSRVGNAYNPSIDHHLESTIISGKKSAKLNSTMIKDQDYQKYSVQLKSIHQDIQALSDKINLPKMVTDTAKQLYNKIFEMFQEHKKSLKGKKKESLIAACIHSACKYHNVQRTFKEIGIITNVSKKEIFSMNKLLTPILYPQNDSNANDHTVNANRIEKSTINTTFNELDNIKTYIERFGYQLGLPANARKIAKIVAINANKADIFGGNSPITLVAVYLYLASHVSSPKTYKEVADICYASKSSVEKAYRQLYECREKITSPEIPENVWVSP